jgi:virulence-associated protein VapD
MTKPESKLQMKEQLDRAYKDINQIVEMLKIPNIQPTLKSQRSYIKTMIAKSGISLV